MKRSLILQFLFLFLTFSLSFSQYLSKPMAISYSEKNKVYYVSVLMGSYESESCMSSVSDGFIINLSTNQPIISGLINPMGLVTVNDTLYFLDACSVKTAKGNSFSNFAGNPYQDQSKRKKLRAICYDGKRNFFISCKDEIYRLNIDTKEYKIYNFGTALNNVYGICWNKLTNKLIIVSNIVNSPIQELNPADSTLRTIKTTTLPMAMGITQDGEENFLVSDWGNGKAGSGKIYLFDKDFSKNPVEFATGLSGPALLYYNPINDTLAIPNKLSNSITFIPCGPPVPIAFNVGDDLKPVSKNPAFRWRNSGSVTYHLQVAAASNIVFKDDGDEMLADDFTNPVINEQDIQDTFYIAKINLEEGKKYVWRIRSQSGSKFSTWSKTLSFTPGQVNDVEDIFSDQFSITPNPSSDFIEISYTPSCMLGQNGETESIHIYNVFGEEVSALTISGADRISSTSQYSLLTTQFSYRVDVSALKPAVYFVRIGEKVGKFLKM